MDRPEGETHSPSVVYYGNGAAHVNVTWLVLPGRRYAIDDLSRLRTVRTPREPLTLNAVAGCVAVAAAVIAVLRFLNAVGWVASAIVLCVPLAVLVLGLIRRPRGWELWAEYQGMTVQLLRELDAERYNRACRAILRAREQAADR